MANSNSLDPPRLVADVTSERLTAALATQYPGVEVQSAAVDDQFGFKPNKARIHLTYNQAGQSAGLPETMVVKLPAPGLGNLEGEMNTEALLDWAAAVEVQSYREIIPTLDIETPRIYYTLLDRKAGKTAILMEDLQRRGFTALHSFTPLNYGHAIAFIDAMAAIHAAHWNSPAIAPGGQVGTEHGSRGCH
jgi:hypothetical protein